MSYKINKNTIIDESNISLDALTKVPVCIGSQVLYDDIMGSAAVGRDTGFATNVGDVAVLNESIRNYDFILIKLGTRVWGWAMEYHLLFVPKISTGTAANVRFTIPYSCYQDPTVYTIELGFTEETHLQIYLNGAVNTGSNGGYIWGITGIKLNAN